CSRARPGLAGYRLDERCGVVPRGGVPPPSRRRSHRLAGAHLRVSPPLDSDFEGLVSQPRAPKHLQPPTRRWWLNVVEEFELFEHHRRLLTLAGECWDRAQQAREALAEQGTTYTDRFGQPRPRPEVNIQRDATIAFARLVRELDLDAESLPPPRPPRRGGG